MKCLVTGHTGFIGSQLCRMLHDAGWEISCVARLKGTGNFNDLRKYVAALQPDVVFHLAGLFVSDHSPDDVEPLIESNVNFGTHILEAMAQSGVKRIITAGTSWQQPRPRNLYAATKTAFDAIMGYYADAHGIKPVTLSFTDTYGPGDTRPKLIPAMLKAAETGSHMAMLPPNHMMDLIHVDDVCRAFIEATNLYSGRWSVSVGPVRLETVVHEFERAAGKKLDVGWGERKYRPRETPEPWIGEILPGWTPKVTLREGMAGLFA
jgi:nucleoside-diphosphate-sugar epimerase